MRAGDIIAPLAGVPVPRESWKKRSKTRASWLKTHSIFEAARARYRNIDCKVDCPAGMPPILVDRVQVQQVILNLAKNAIQSVDENGKVMVRIATEADQMRFTVSDTGPGVLPERLERLFEPFSTTKTEGMGLGLPICRSIIEAHGGRIWYEPSPAGGASFVFTLPHFMQEY